MIVDIAYDVRPPQPTPRTRRVHEMFGLGEGARQVKVFDGFQIDPQPGQVILVTGPSGSGKSTLVRYLAQRLAGVVNLAEVTFRCDRALVDDFDVDLDRTLEHLSHAGLAEAFLFLRSFDQLSDGQRYRARLAKALASGAAWVVADEFCANLDRPLARVIAYNVRRVADRYRTGFLLATTHRDFVEDLRPDVWVEKGFGADVKKAPAAPPPARPHPRSRWSTR